MPVTLQLYKAHTLSLSQAHIMIAGGAALLFAKMERLMCDCCLSPVKAVSSFLRRCQAATPFHLNTQVLHSICTDNRLITQTEKANTSMTVAHCTHPLYM